MRDGQPDPATVAKLTQAELIVVAHDLARFSELSLTPYTAAVLRRLADEIETPAK